MILGSTSLTLPSHLSGGNPQGGLADQDTVTDSIPAARTTANEVMTPPPEDHAQVTTSPDHQEA